MAQLINTSLFTDANLQGYWRMENNWNDSGPNTYNLTATNTPTFVAGKYGLAGNFVSASSQYSTIANASCANLEISGSQTWVCWVKPATLTSYQAPMSKTKSDLSISHGLLTSADSSGIAYFDMTGLTTNTQVNSGATITPTGVWSHLAGVYNSATTTLKIYVNGIERGSVTASGSATNTTGDFSLGRAGSNNGRYYNGAVDDAAIFNRALSAAEINILVRDTGGAFLSLL